MRKMCTLGTGVLALAATVGTGLAAHADMRPAVRQDVGGY